MGQPRVPSHPQSLRGWGQRWQWGDPHSPALLPQPPVGNAGGISPKNSVRWRAGPCMFPTSAMQLETVTVPAAATPTAEGPGFCWTIRGSGLYPNQEGPGFTLPPAAERRHSGPERGSQLPSPPNVGSPWPGCTGLELAHNRHKASFMRREKSSLPLTPPAAFPLRSLPRMLGQGYFHPHSGWHGDDAPQTPPTGAAGLQRGLHTSCPARCHHMAPTPRSTRASSHSARGLGASALP